MMLALTPGSMKAQAEEPTADLAVASYKGNGDEKYYDSLKSAVEAANADIAAENSGGTLTLMKDTTVTETLVLGPDKGLTYKELSESMKGYTIDLNGHTITYEGTGTDKHLFKIESLHLTLINSSTNKAGLTAKPDKPVAGYPFTTTGIIKVGQCGGNEKAAWLTIGQAGNDQAMMEFCVVDETNNNHILTECIRMDEGNLTIEGGTNHFTAGSRVLYEDRGNLLIQGGINTITGVEVGIASSSATNPDPSLTIRGGVNTIEGGAFGIDLGRELAFCNIEGGINTYRGGKAAISFGCPVNISGGTNTAEYLDSEQYKASRRQLVCYKNEDVNNNGKSLTITGGDNRFSGDADHLVIGKVNVTENDKNAYYTLDISGGTTTMKGAEGLIELNERDTLKASAMMVQGNPDARIEPSGIRDQDGKLLTEATLVGKYVVTYKRGSLDGSPVPDTVVIPDSESVEKAASGDTTCTLAEAPAWMGHHFDGWQIGDTKTIKQAGDEIALTNLAEEDGTLTCTATWSLSTYTVTFDSNGGSSVAAQTVSYQGKATKPSDPTKEGYRFVEWQLDGASYDFGKAVSENLILKAVWTATQKQDDDKQGDDKQDDDKQGDDKPGSTQFTDVDPNKFYAAPVAWAVEKGITSGTSATTFSPNDTCTRAQAVTFLYRTVGETVEPKATFEDVPLGKFYSAPVTWAVEKGITSGTSATTFGSGEDCTRGQVMTFIWRTKGHPAAAATTRFTDVPDGKFYSIPVAWAVENGITSGTSATTFSPEAKCTRGQIVTFLYRVFK